MTSGEALTAGLPPVTLVVGKGGVGKTTVAAALGTQYARERQRTLIVTTDPAATLFSAFGRPIERSARPRTVDIGYAEVDLWAFDTAAIRNDFLTRWRDPISVILDRGTYLDTDDIRGLVDAALPGADEIFAMLALGDVLARTGDDAYARIVVDTAPTGHTLRLLNLPRTFSALVRLLDAMQEKHRFMVRALTHRYRRDAADDFIADLRERVDLLQKTLTDPERAAAILVTRPEPVVIAESKRYVDALYLVSIRLAAIVVNAWDGSAEQRGLVGPLVNEVVFLHVVPRLEETSTLLEAMQTIDLASATAATESKSPDRPARVTSTSAAVEVSGLVRPLTIVGGKGGVGKTTVACALAIASADEGRSTLLVSTDPAPSVGDALGLFIGDDEVVVPGAPRLVARQMDASVAFTTFRDRYRDRIDELFEGLAGRGLDIAHDRDIIRDLLSLAPPGIDELYAMTVLGDALAEGRFMHIVIDPAPTGHLLRLLEMPAMAVAWAHQLMRMMLKYKEVVGLGEAAQDLLAFAKRTRALDEQLRDGSRAGAVLVTLDEPLVRGESERLASALSGLSVDIGAVVWNRATESTTPLPTPSPIPQLFAPFESPAPSGVDSIRAWTRQWGTMSPGVRTHP